MSGDLAEPAQVDPPRHAGGDRRELRASTWSSRSCSIGAPTRRRSSTTRSSCASSRSGDRRSCSASGARRCRARSAASSARRESCRRWPATRSCPRPLRVLGRGSGPDDEPRIGTYVSLALALVVVAVGDLNAVAPVLTMFFLASYAVVNLVSAGERFLQSPSFRPTFRVHWTLSLVGALGCVAVMFLINPLATIVAMAIVIADLGACSTGVGRAARWGDIRQGMWLALVRLGGRPHPAVDPRQELASEHPRAGRQPDQAVVPDRSRQRAVARSWLCSRSPRSSPSRHRPNASGSSPRPCVSTSPNARSTRSSGSCRHRLRTSVRRCSSRPTGSAASCRTPCCSATARPRPTPTSTPP